MGAWQSELDPALFIRTRLEIPAVTEYVAASCGEGHVTKFYVDGVEAKASNNGSWVGLCPAPGFDVAIGKASRSNSAFFKGRIDEIRIYNRVLTPDEIATHAKARQE